MPEDRTGRALEDNWASLEQRQSMLERGVTLSDLIERYKAESLDVRHSTRASYLSRLNCHIIPHWGDQAIANIKPLEVERRIHSLPGIKKDKITHQVPATSAFRIRNEMRTD
jgi:hypothetical protein